MSNSNDLFSNGRPNPEMAGIPLRFMTSGSEPDPKRIEAAATLLARPVKFVDDGGYENELVAASPIEQGGKLAYLFSSAKDLGTHVDINFYFVVRDDQGREFTSAIQSYNPYFGCDVGFLDWLGDSAVLIYQEKHDTYVAVATSDRPARYRVIAPDWSLSGDQLGYWKYKEHVVKRVSLPHLTELPSLSESEAMTAGLLPPKRW